VSIGLGIKCIDGVVLCADTQYTAPGSHKFYDRKIFVVGRDNPTTWVSFAFAGNPDLMRMFDERFSSIVQDRSYSSTLVAIRQTLADVLEEMDQKIASDQSGLYMLCGITVAEEEPVLLKISRQIVCPVDLYDYVGVGDCSVVRYLSKVLFQSPKMTVKAASLLGTYLILQAKTFVDECGGETDLVALLPNGKINVKDRGITGSYEQQAGWLEFFFARIVASLSNPEDRSNRLESDIDRFIRRLRDTAGS